MDSYTSLVRAWGLAGGTACFSSARDGNLVEAAAMRGGFTDFVRGPHSATALDSDYWKIGLGDSEIIGRDGISSSMLRYRFLPPRIMCAMPKQRRLTSRYQVAARCLDFQIWEH